MKKFSNATSDPIKVWMHEVEVWIAPGETINVDEQFAVPGFEPVVATTARKKKGEAL